MDAIKIKAAVRAVPLARPAWRWMKSLVRSARTAPGRLSYWLPFSISRGFRAAIFDAAKPDTLLLSNIGRESYLVSSNDRYIGRDTFIHGSYDLEKLERTLSLLDREFEGDLLIDVGANIGTISIPALKRGLFDRAVAIEPEPFNYSLLTCNIHMNGLAGRMTAHHLALGARAGEELSFELSDTNYGDHRIRMSSCQGGTRGEAQRKVIRVKSEPFDEVVGPIDPARTLIWMDTQGFEGYVLQGARQALQQRPPLVVEFWPYAMKRSGSYPALRQALLDAGYDVFHDLGTNSPPTRLTGGTLDTLYRRLGETGPYTDLLLR